MTTLNKSSPWIRSASGPASADPKAVIYPDPPGGYNPQFSCDTPNHLKFKGGHQGVFTGCLCNRDGRGQILTRTNLFTL